MQQLLLCAVAGYCCIRVDLLPHISYQTVLNFLDMPPSEISLVSSTPVFFCSLLLAACLWLRCEFSELVRRHRTISHSSLSLFLSPNFICHHNPQVLTPTCGSPKYVPCADSFILISLCAALACTPIVIMCQVPYGRSRSSCSLRLTEFTSTINHLIWRMGKHLLELESAPFLAIGEH